VIYKVGDIVEADHFSHEQFKIINFKNNLYGCMSLKYGGCISFYHNVLTLISRKRLNCPEYMKEL